LPGKGDQQARGHASQVLAVVALVAVAVVLVLSYSIGAPKKLPDIALGWVTLLYIERAALVALLIMGLGGLMAS
jgi:hypothetical protein